MKLHVYDPAAEQVVYTFNEATNRGYINVKIEGLGPPGTRSSRGTYAGRSGGYSGRRYWDPRLITASGTLIADTAAEMQQHRLYWSEVFSSLDDLHLLIEHEDGSQYIVFCGIDGTPTLEYNPLNLQVAPFSVSFLADDPVIYDNTAGMATTVTLARTVGGGLTWPVVWPATWAPGAGATTVVNGGKVPIQPLITLTGSMTNPQLLNETTGELLSLPGFSTPAGSVVVVDLYNESITLNGGNITGQRSVASSFWSLETGPNTIKLSTTDVADTVSGEMTWRNGVMGI